MDAIKNKLLKNFKHKSKWARNNSIEAFRLYDRELPDYPYIVDSYGKYLIIYKKTNPKLDENKAHHLNHIIQALSGIYETNEDYIIVKERKIQTRDDKYIRNDKSTNKELRNLVVNEHQAKFEVNLYDYLDTGLFLDHRPIRQVIFNSIKKNNSQSFLNLFSYTCSVSVFAALSGAKTTSIDLSKKYLDWGKRNFLLNNIPLFGHHFFNKSAITYLEEDPTESFDLIFLDPPTFSNSKKMDTHFDVSKDQGFLVTHCMKRLKKDGILYFSNNLRSFKLNEEIKNQYFVKDITSKSIPVDFNDKKIHHLFEIRFNK